MTFRFTLLYLKKILSVSLPCTKSFKNGRGRSKMDEKNIKFFMEY